MSAVKKSISIAENLVKEANAINSNFSLVVEAALVQYIQQYKTKKALESFGGWEARDESSTDIVNNLRRNDNRNPSEKNSKKKKRGKQQ
jgi:hypothetical protein